MVMISHNITWYTITHHIICRDMITLRVRKPLVPALDFAAGALQTVLATAPSRFDERPEDGS